MSQRPPPSEPPRAQRLTERVLANFDKFLHIEATSGIVLLLAAAAALIWANSPWLESYQSLWHTPLALGVGEHVFSRSLHFWINDGLMTLFFLLIGMEIRRELHEGALSQAGQALLPMAAALGGVVVPALIYLGLNHGSIRAQGWAVPTATDIAFAVGILALLGRSIPGGVRVFLLTLAIIDDVIAVLIIALFYSSGLDSAGFALAGIGIVLTWLLQRLGIGHAYAYVIPGAIVWAGFLVAGIHPTLAGVVLGLMTPVYSLPRREHPLDTASRITRELTERFRKDKEPSFRLRQPLQQLRLAQREMQPPVVRVQSALHPWVSYAIMPLFALANAGIVLGGNAISTTASHWVILSVMLALVAGKPLGVILTSWILVRLGLCQLPANTGWGGVWLVGLLAGIGFTMSIFIAMLAFTDGPLLQAAKLGVLLGSLVAGSLGIAWGVIYTRRLRAA